MIVGVDEVGRGCWAGPLLVGAVALAGHEIEGLTDSKKLTAKRREELAREIRIHAAAIGLGWVSPRLIDEYGLSWALRAATRMAVDQIAIGYDEIIIDGTVKFIDDPRVSTLKQADLLIPSVSAASIIAKVARDRYMARMDRAFNGYSFARHVGYGTKMHRAALEEYGATAIHRMSFAPLAGYSNSTLLHKKEKARPAKIEYTSGRQAEALAASFLSQQGYDILQQNWRTRWCEIDIVASKDGVIHFVEVKYRKNARVGDGLTAITPKKVEQMKKAATMWAQVNSAITDDQCLSVIALEKEPMRVAHWLPNITV